MIIFFKMVRDFNKDHFYMPLIIVVLVGALGFQRVTASPAVEVETASSVKGKIDVGGGFTIEPVPIPKPIASCVHCPACNTCCPKVSGWFNGSASGSASASATAKVNVSMPVWGLSLGVATNIAKVSYENSALDIGLNYKNTELFYRHGIVAEGNRVKMVGIRKTWRLF